MVLPMLIYDLEEETRHTLLRTLGQIGRKTETPVQLQLATNDLDEMMNELRALRHVCLLVIGVPPEAADRNRLAIRLGRFAMMLNRDHYIVYIIKERSELESVLSYCARSAGILLCPPEEQAMQRVLTPVLEDYRRLYGDTPAEDERFISLKAEGKMIRMRMGDICTVQAVNKMIEFRTMKETVAVYASMSAAEAMLDDSFIRCHRSYLINRNMIQYVAFRQMIIHMMDGTEVPLARSYKEKMHDSMAGTARA